MNIIKNIEEQVGTLAIEGRLDTVSSPELEDAIVEVLPEITELVFDFKDLEYISSAGLRIILKAQKAMNIQGSMKIINVNEYVMEIFEMTGFVDILTIE